MDPVKLSRERLIDIANHLMCRELEHICISLSGQYPKHTLAFGDAMALAEMAIEAFHALKEP